MGLTVRGIFNDTTLTALTVPSTPGEVRITANRALHVNLRNAAGTEMGTVANPLIVTSSGGAGGGTSSLDDSPFVGGVNSFTPTGGVFNDGLAGLASGQQGEVRMTSTRALHVNLRTTAGAEFLGQQLMAASLPVTIASNQSKLGVNLNDGAGNAIGSVAGAINVNIASGGGSGFSVPDGTAWVAGTTALVPAGGVFNDSAAALTTGTEGTLRMTPNRAQHVSLRTQAGIELLGQQTMAASIPVTLASDQSSLAVTGPLTDAQLRAVAVPVSGPLTDVQLRATAVPVSGPLTDAQLRATPVPVSGTVTTTPPANASSNIAQINGVTPLMGNGPTGTGSLRVTIANDNTTFPVTASQGTASNFNAQVVGNVAHGTADSGNPVKVGAKAYTTSITSEVAGDRVDLIADKQGALITVLNKPREFLRTQQTTITSSTSETTIITAGGAGVFNDIVSLTITNSSATALIVTLKDATAGTTRAIYALAANGGITIPFPTPLAQQAAANNNWTLTCGTSVASIYVSAAFVINT